MRHKLPIKHLIKSSGKLLLYFSLASMMIGSVYEPDLKTALLRFISVNTFFILAFFINIAVLVFYHNRKKTPAEKIGKKTFITGYILTTLLFTLHHFINLHLQKAGINISDPDIVEKLRGWRIVVFLPHASLILYTFIFLIHNFILHQYEKNKIELELLKLQSTNTETANQLLRQQIQPHFLFNALNVLKSLIKKYPQTAEAYLIKLSEFLRASISSNPSGIATVMEELKLCNDYMEMQKIRFGNTLDYTVEIPKEGTYMESSLPFFSLQPLLENAIKHNELTQDNPLFISIKKEGNQIVVRNNLQPKNIIENSTGNGLSNLRERYKILSGDDISIKKENGFFSVSIEILKNENSSD